MTVTAEQGSARPVVALGPQARRNAWDARRRSTAIADAIEAAGRDEAVRCVVAARRAASTSRPATTCTRPLEADADELGGDDRRLPAPHARRARRPGPGPRRDRRRVHRRRARVRGQLRPAPVHRPRALRHARGGDRPRRHATPARCSCPRCSARPRRASCCSPAQLRDAGLGATRTASSTRSSPRTTSTRASRTGRRVFDAASRAPRSRATKAMLNERFGPLLAEAMAREERACVELFDGPDAPAALRGLRRAPRRALTILPSAVPSSSEPLLDRPGHALPVGRPPRGQQLRPRAPDELAGRGHRVLGRRAVGLERPRARRAPRPACGRVLGPPPARSRLLAVGEALPPPARARGAPRCRSTSRARSRSSSRSSRSTSATSTSRSRRASRASALRHSRALNVGTFHAPTERVLATQVARKRRPARLRPPRRAHRGLRGHGRAHARFFPADYDVVAPGRRPAGAPGAARRSACGSPSSTTRSAARCGCSCARCGGWTPSCRGRRSCTPRADRRPRRRCAPSCASACASSRASDEALAAGRRARRRRPTASRPRPALLLRAPAAGAVPVAARLPVYEEVARRGRARAAVRARRRRHAGRASCARLVATRRCASACAAAAARRGSLERGRRRARGASTRALRRAPPRRARRRRPRAAPAGPPDSSTSTCTCTPTTATTAPRRSRCCWRPRATRGSGAIAVTDHNEISGALEAAAKAARVRREGHRRPRRSRPRPRARSSASSSSEQIPRGLTLAETVAEIKRQGGARLRAPPVRPDARRARLRAPARRSSRTSTRSRSTTRAWRSARSTRRRRASRPSTGSPAGAGSDAHVAQGLGSVRVRMRDFDGPEEFLESLRDAEIVTQAGDPALRAGAEVPGDQGHAARRRASAAVSGACAGRPARR